MIIEDALDIISRTLRAAGYQAFTPVSGAAGTGFVTVDDDSAFGGVYPCWSHEIADDKAYFTLLSGYQDTLADAGMLTATHANPVTGQPYLRITAISTPK